MKKTVTTVVLAGLLLLAGMHLHAQNKIGYISFNELLVAMPEFKKADTTLAEYRSALAQRFEEFKEEYSVKLKEITGPDTSKLTKVQMELKKKTLSELLVKLQGYDEEAGNMLTQKRNELLLPIQKKAEDAIQQVAKDNGYAYVMEKEGLHVFPASDDVLPLVKKKLGIK
jgi:outer membrane protein